MEAAGALLSVVDLGAGRSGAVQLEVVPAAVAAVAAVLMAGVPWHQQS